MRWRILQGVGALLLGTTSAGCYTYRAVTPDEVAPQDRIRVTISAERSMDLADVFQGYPTRTFNAVYLNGQDELLLSVPFQNPVPGTSSAPIHNRVTVPRVDVVSIETRELSGWRTAVAVGGLGVAVGAAAVVAFSGDSDPQEGKRGEVDTFRFPLFSWAWGR